MLTFKLAIVLSEKIVISGRYLSRPTSRIKNVAERSRVCYKCNANILILYWIESESQFGLFLQLYFRQRGMFNFKTLFDVQLDLQKFRSSS